MVLNFPESRLVRPDYREIWRQGIFVANELFVCLIGFGVQFNFIKVGNPHKVLLEVSRVDVP